MEMCSMLNYTHYNKKTRHLCLPELRNIISVCRSHHQEIHNYSNIKKVSVRIATNHLRKKYSPEYWIKNRVKETIINN